MGDIKLTSNSIVMLGISVKLSGRVESYNKHINNLFDIEYKINLKISFIYVGCIYLSKIDGGSIKNLNDSANNGYGNTNPHY